MKKLVLFLTLTCLLFAFDKVQAQDEISAITAPDPVTAGTTEVVTVNYTATDARDIIISIQDVTTWSNWGNVKVSVAAGTGSINVNLPISSSAPVGVDVCKIGAYMAPTGLGWNDKTAENNVFNIDVLAYTGPVDLIKNVTTPAQVSQGETITVAVEYEVSESRDILINVNLNSDPWTNYGTSTVTVDAGTGTVNIDVDISSDIPVATGAYSIGTAVTTIGGGWPARIHFLKANNIDATVSTSLEVNQIDLGVNVSPNPAQESATIKSETVIKNVSLYTLTGKLMMNKNVESNVFSLDTTPYSKGLYILSVTNENGTSTTKLVIN